MSRALIGPAGGCALHGAILTALAIDGVVPLVHSTPGCALRAGLSLRGPGRATTAPAALPPLPSTNLAERHVVFGGTSRLREQIKNTLAVVPGRLLTVLTGCPTEMIGDDVTAMVKEVTTQGEAVIDIATAGFHGTARHGAESFMTALANWVGKLDPRRRGTEAGLVNLFGIVPRVDPGWLGNLEEIERLLAGVGLKVNPLIGPSGGFESLQALPSAEASLVLSPWGLGPARTLSERFGIPVVQAAGLPVGADAVRQVLDLLSEVLGRPIDEAGQKFLDVEQRLEDFVLNESLESLVGIGRRRFALAGGSLVAGPVARFLGDVLGWSSAAILVTDDPPEQSFGPLSAGLDRVRFLSDAAAIAEAVRASEADVVIGGSAERDLAEQLRLPFVEVFPPSALGTLSEGHAGARGARRLVAAILRTFDPEGIGATITTRPVLERGNETRLATVDGVPAPPRRIGR
ncbi:nitrogenase component 1 [Rhodovulum strictum]|uniref:Nitrogenase n=1 Tax=Rhodovulum strictum TaxID=58314 RepID=A0A844BK62_9RHOB|nr:nitrogenase component 1 [Rhodovulum strictum]MRH21402.1 nitrogenase [Rhodovulum strictum]